MIEAVTNVEASSLQRFDAIIDVRSPAEFADDRLPDAINLPVLSDAERAIVGEVYVQQSRFLARRIGAALVARNIAGHLDAALADKPAKWRPLVYCWRGGQRSLSMATVMSEVGWRVSVLTGGYKTWRRRVVSELHGDGAAIRAVLIDGLTGTGKTEIIRRLIERGAPALDIEGLACHRGSAFGGDPALRQPGQRLFESRLWSSLSRLQPFASVAIEAESARIGRLSLPKRLWTSMRAAPFICVEADREARAAYLAGSYRGRAAQLGFVSDGIARLKPFHPKSRILHWEELFAAGDLERLIRELLRDHYDPLYERLWRSRRSQPLASIRLADLGPHSLEMAAASIEKLLRNLADR